MLIINDHKVFLPTLSFIIPIAGGSCDSVVSIRTVWSSSNIHISILLILPEIIPNIIFILTLISVVRFSVCHLAITVSIEGSIEKKNWNSIFILESYLSFIPTIATSGTRGVSFIKSIIHGHAQTLEN